MAVVYELIKTPHHESDVPLAQKRNKVVQEVAWTEQGQVPVALLR